MTTGEHSLPLGVERERGCAQNDKTDDSQIARFVMVLVFEFTDKKLGNAEDTAMLQVLIFNFYGRVVGVYGD